MSAISKLLAAAVPAAFLLASQPSSAQTPPVQLYPESAPALRSCFKELAGKSFVYGQSMNLSFLNTTSFLKGVETFKIEHDNPVAGFSCSMLLSAPIDKSSEPVMITTFQKYDDGKGILASTSLTQALCENGSPGYVIGFANNFSTNNGSALRYHQSSFGSFAAVTNGTENTEIRPSVFDRSPIGRQMGKDRSLVEFVMTDDWVRKRISETRITKSNPPARSCLIS